jgi:exosortase
MAVVLGVLLRGIPYTSGYGWIKIPLGSFVWDMWNQPDYQHGFLVPVICLFLLYLKRKEIASAPIAGHSWALGLIVLGFFTYWIGMRAAMQYYGFIAVQMLIAGLVLWFWGKAMFKAVCFPWIFLAFAWPVPFLDSLVAFRLRMITSHLAAIVLNFCLVPCVQNGTALLSAPEPLTGVGLGDKFQIDIADPCSGMHSLLALMMFSALAGYLFTAVRWKRWLIFLAALPLAIAGNLVRIVMLTLATLHFGSAFAIGTEADPSTFHMACGFAVYIVALLLLMGLMMFLRCDWDRPTRLLADLPTPPDAVPLESR